MDRREAMSMLVAAAETGSLSAAARKLGVPLPTLCREVAELEAHLKTRLLVRTTRKLALTETGVTYLSACKRILEQVGDAETEASGEFSTPRGELHLRDLCGNAGTMEVRLPEPRSVATGGSTLPPQHQHRGGGNRCRDRWCRDNARAAGTRVSRAVAEGKLKVVLKEFEPEPAPVHIIHAGQGLVPLNKTKLPRIRCARLRKALADDQSRLV